MNRFSMQSSDDDDGNVVFKQEISLHVHQHTFDDEYNKLKNITMQQSTDLNTRIDDLISERDELRRVMLVRALATATQFALTEQFPVVFGNKKFRYAFTYDDIKAVVLKTRESNHEAKLNEVVAVFEGIDETDIVSQLQVIREIGTVTCHPTTMIASEKTEYVPTPE